jgi:hypothetical protein
MYSLDSNINLSVERANGRRQAVQAHGHQRGTETAASFGQTDDGKSGGRLVLRFVTALLVAAVIVGLVIAL